LQAFYQCYSFDFLKRMKDLILASGSSRRVKLLDLADLVFEAQQSYASEGFDKDLSPELIVRNLAVLKAKTVFDGQRDKKSIVVVGADTIVVLNNQILNKPHSFDEAFSMLRSLSGKTHQVITGICILSEGTELSFTEITEVTFNHLTDEQINYYITNYPPYDKAGGYAIQEWIGVVGVKKISGDYYNVMGLPVNKLLKKLNGLGIEVKRRSV